MNSIASRLWRPSAVLEALARVGYGARGFVYLTIGALALLAAIDVGGDVVGAKGALTWILHQPLGRLWLVLLGLGLWAFVAWRIAQAVFDADREGASPASLLLRGGQAVSGVFYGLLASGVFELLDEVGANPSLSDSAENREKAEMVLALPFGDIVLILAGVVIALVGAGNMMKGLRSDFGETLACSRRLCRRLTLIARAGYVARGVAYLPFAVLVSLAGLHSRSSDVTSFGSALQAVEGQPLGSWFLAATAIGLCAFGAFAFVEARFRKIRAPRDLSVT